MSISVQVYLCLYRYVYVCAGMSMSVQVCLCLYRYAYSGRPVVVIDAMENWTAQHVFSFQFFKGVYEESLEHWTVQSGCQFFPYETEFTQLREVFNMSEDRAHMRDGTRPWYIGW